MKIVFLDRYSLGDSDLSAIKALGDYTEYENTAQSEVVERCCDAHVVITNKVKIMREEIDSLPSLRLICIAATGMNNVDLEYAAQKGIEVRNVPAYSTQSVAETTFSMVLGLLRNIVFYDDYIKNGTYAASDRCFNLDRSTSQISGRRWGVVGLGNIGQRVASLASAFGASVCYYSTSGRNTKSIYEHLQLGQLLAECDIVSIHCPLNEQTRNLIGREQLSMMKSNAIIVNVGRGGIVDESALAEALNRGVIAGAGLDVFDSEPITADNPLLKIDDPYKLLMSPHCAWSSAEARRVLVAKIAENIQTFQQE